MERDQDELRLAGALMGMAALLASIVIGIVFAPFQARVGLENVTILYMAVVAVAAVTSGRLGGLIAAISAALSYNFFFTTPYRTLRIDSASQVVTVLLLFLGGLLASVVGGFQRRARAQSRQEERALWLVYEVLRARVDGRNAPKVAVTQVRRMLDAQWVGIVRDSAIRTSAGAVPADLDPAALPELDEDGLLRDGQIRRAVLPGGGAAFPIQAGGQRTGSLVIVPGRRLPVTLPVRLALLAVADGLGDDPATAPEH